MCLFKIASLKWMIVRSGLHQALELQKQSAKNKKVNCQGLPYNLPCNDEASESTVRALTAQVADMLKVKGRAHCNPESTHLNTILVANAILIYRHSIV